MKRWLIPLLVSIVGTALVLGGLEIAARRSGDVTLSHPSDALTELFQPDPDTFWSLRPNYYADNPMLNPRWGGEPIAINSHGLRSPEVTLEKPDGVRRVLVLGGSHPMGMWVKAGEAYSAVLERLLNERQPGRWQVINGAVPGYTSWQGVLQLRTGMLDYEPDIVISDLGVNDSLERVAWGRSRADQDVRPPPRLVGAVMEWLRGHSAAYRVALQRLTERSNRQPTARVSRAEHHEHVLEIERLASAAGARTVFMNQFSANVPRPGVLSPDPPRCVYPGTELDPVVDVCAIFMGRDDLAQLFADPLHANATGHAMIAHAVLDKLLALGWVE